MFYRSLASVVLCAATVLLLVGCASGTGVQAESIGGTAAVPEAVLPSAMTDDADAAALAPRELAAAACTAVAGARNQGDSVFYDGLAAAAERSDRATVADGQWLPLSQALSALVESPRPEVTSTQPDLDAHYNAYLAVVIACLPAGVVLPTD